MWSTACGAERRRLALLGPRYSLFLVLDTGPRWSEQWRPEWALPWEAEVVDDAAGQSQLGVGGDDELPVGLLGCAQRRRRPAEGSLREPVAVFDVIASQVGAPAQAEIGLTFS